MVYWMDICHAVVHYSPNLLQTFKVTHCANCIALHENITPRQQLQSLQSRALRPKYALPALDETLYKISAPVVLRDWKMRVYGEKKGLLCLEDEVS